MDLIDKMPHQMSGLFNFSDLTPSQPIGALRDPAQTVASMLPYPVDFCGLGYLREDIRKLAP
jgi:hypothetical protein